MENILPQFDMLLRLLKAEAGCPPGQHKHDTKKCHDAQTKHRDGTYNAQHEAESKRNRIDKIMSRGNPRNQVW